MKKKKTVGTGKFRDASAPEKFVVSFRYKPFEGEYEKGTSYIPRNLHLRMVDHRIAGLNATEFRVCFILAHEVYSKPRKCAEISYSDLSKRSAVSREKLPPIVERLQAKRLLRVV